MEKNSVVEKGCYLRLVLRELNKCTVNNNWLLSGERGALRVSSFPGVLEHKIIRHLFTYIPLVSLSLAAYKWTWPATFTILSFSFQSSLEEVDEGVDWNVQTMSWRDISSFLSIFKYCSTDRVHKLVYQFSFDWLKDCKFVQGLSLSYISNSLGKDHKEKALHCTYRHVHEYFYKKKKSKMRGLTTPPHLD